MSFFGGIGRTFTNIGRTITVPINKLVSNPTKLNLGDALTLGSVGVLAPAVNAVRNPSDALNTALIGAAVIGGGLGVAALGPAGGFTTGIGYAGGLVPGDVGFVGPVNLVGTAAGPAEVGGFNVAAGGTGASFASDPVFGIANTSAFGVPGAASAPIVAGSDPVLGSIAAGTATTASGGSSVLSTIGSGIKTGLSDGWKALTTVAGAKEVLQLLGVGGAPGGGGGSAGGGGIEGALGNLFGSGGGGTSGGSDSPSTTINQASSIPTWVYAAGLALAGYWLAKRYKLI